jgi:hypothetical protein
VRIRDVKPVAEIDRLSTVSALLDQLQVAGRGGVRTAGPKETEAHAAA